MWSRALFTKLHQINNDDIRVESNAPTCVRSKNFVCFRCGLSFHRHLQRLTPDTYSGVISRKGRCAELSRVLDKTGRSVRKYARLASVAEGKKTVKWIILTLAFCWTKPQVKSNNTPLRIHTRPFRIQPHHSECRTKTRGAFKCTNSWQWAVSVRQPWGTYY